MREETAASRNCSERFVAVRNRQGRARERGEVERGEVAVYRGQMTKQNCVIRLQWAQDRE